MPRTSKTKVIHPVDLSKPVPVAAFNTAADTEDCYTFLWKPDDSMCVVCASQIMCGILYHGRQTAKVKDLEASKGGYLDSSLFECIETEDLVMWCSVKQRTAEQLIAKVMKFSKCPDEQTVIDYCKSFIKSTEGVSCKGGIIIINR